MGRYDPQIRSTARVPRATPPAVRLVARSTPRARHARRRRRRSALRTIGSIRQRTPASMYSSSSRTKPGWRGLVRTNRLARPSARRSVGSEAARLVGPPRAPSADQGAQHQATRRRPRPEIRPPIRTRQRGAATSLPMARSARHRRRGDHRRPDEHDLIRVATSGAPYPGIPSNSSELLPWIAQQIGAVAGSRMGGFDPGEEMR